MHGGQCRHTTQNDKDTSVHEQRRTDLLLRRRHYLDLLEHVPTHPKGRRARSKGKEVDMENHCHCSDKAQNKSDGGPNLGVRTAARIFAYVASHAIWDLLS